jgi:hypothetical protein
MNFVGGVGAIVLVIAQSFSSNADKREIIQITKDENTRLSERITELPKERADLKSDLEIRDEKISHQTKKIEDLNQALLEKSQSLEQYITGGKIIPTIKVTKTANVKVSDVQLLFVIENPGTTPLYDINVEGIDYDIFKQKSYRNENDELTSTKATMNHQRWPTKTLQN